jgi:cyclic beta-1,2-glucan synthetase
VQPAIAKEFIGRNGSVRQTSGNARGGSGKSRRRRTRFRAPLYRFSVELAPNEAREVVFFIGEADSKESARKLASEFRQPGKVNAAFERVLAYWDQVLGTIEVKYSRWSIRHNAQSLLLYQSLSCRVWARTAFYQSGVPMVFRDQLQDVMSLVYSRT